MWQPRPLSHPLTPTRQRGLGRAQGLPLAQREGTRTCTTHNRLTPQGPESYRAMSHVLWLLGEGGYAWVQNLGSLPLTSVSAFSEAGMGVTWGSRPRSRGGRRST